MTRLGMDVDVVERSGRALQREAERLSTLTGEIDRLVNTLGSTWFGRSSARFTNEQWPQSRSQLLRAVESVAGLGQSALANAQEQRGTSASAGSSGHWGGGGWVSGSDARPQRTIRLDADGLHVRETNELLDREWHREGHWSDDSGGVQKSVDAEVTARVKAGTHRSFDVGPDGLTAEAGADAEASAVATATASAAAGGAQIAATGTAAARARAAATAKASLGPDGVKAHAGIGAEATVEVSGEVSAEVPGVKTTAEGSLKLGLDAHAEGDLEVSMDEVHLTFDAGVALGFGGGFQADVTVSPRAVLESMSHLLPEPTFTFPWSR